MDKTIDMYLHVVSPVHIGCDEVYEPTAFLVNEQKKKLIAFDSMDFIKSLSLKEREEFNDLCMQGTVASLIGIYRFVAGKSIDGKEVDVTADFITHYRDVKSLPSRDEKRINQELNRFAISRTAFNPLTSMPYIPGSSIKGALRTAYLSKLAKERGIRNFGEGRIEDYDKLRDDKIYSLIGNRRMAHELEINLLKGTFETDPFRLVKISDFLPFGEVKTKIVYAVNKKKRTSKHEARGPFQILETVQSGTVFKGTTNIQQPHKEAKIQDPVTFETLWRAVAAFYQPAFEKESKVLMEIGADGNVADSVKAIFPNGFGEKTILVRIGRHSGAETVTIEGNRYIRIMQAKGTPPKFESRATTIWLASEARKPVNNTALIPFGWAVLSLDLPSTFLSEPDKKDIVQKPITEDVLNLLREEEKPVDKFIASIKQLNRIDAGRIGSTIDRALRELISDEDRRKFAQAVRDYLGKEFKKSKAKAKVEKYLREQ